MIYFLFLLCDSFQSEHYARQKKRKEFDLTYDFMIEPHSSDVFSPVACKCLFSLGMGRPVIWSHASLSVIYLFIVRQRRGSVYIGRHLRSE
jgi:hypothetical protein